MEIALYLIIALSLLLMFSPAIYFIAKGNKKKKLDKRKQEEFFENCHNPAKIILTRFSKDNSMPVFVDEIDDGDTDIIKQKSGKIGWSHGQDVDIFLSPGTHILLARATRLKVEAFLGNKLISIGPIRLEVTVEAGRSYILTYIKEKNEFNLQEER